MLEIRNLQKQYEGKPLLRDINLQVKGGETLCLLGRSGSGKSTLLRIVAGLEPADGGEVRWNGENIVAVPTWQRQFGLMFQDYALFPHRNVEENVAFGLRMQGTPKPQLHSLVAQALDLVNMSGFEKRRVTDLSGGEQQRIALARALAPHPRLLMLDEPLAALDRALRLELQDELRVMLQKTEIPVIYVTHDQEEAFTLGDRLAILAEGVVAQEGLPREVYELPASRRVAEFLGMNNFIQGKIITIDPLTVETASGVFPGVSPNSAKMRENDQVQLLLRTRGVTVSSQYTGQSEIRGRVIECAFKGDDFKITIQTDQTGSMVFSLPEPHQVGTPVILKIPSSSVIVLGGE